MKHEVDPPKRVTHHLSLSRTDVIRIINAVANGDRSHLSLKKELRDAKIEIPHTAEVYVHIPGGGDHSHMDFAIDGNNDDENYLQVRWEADK